MKLVIVITGMSFGGAERVTAYVSNYLIQQGTSVTILALNKTEPAYALDPTIEYQYFDASTYSNRLSRDLSLMMSLRKTIGKIQPDLVLGMMSYSGTLAAFSCIGIKIPVILSERNDPHTSTAFNNLEKHIIRFAYRHLAKNAIFQTQGAKEYYYGNQGKGWIIPNPLYLEEIPLPMQSPPNTRRIISAGRLSKQKNYALLIRAFAKVHSLHPDYSLVIYGEGPERKMLETLIEELRLPDAIRLPGIEADIFSQLQRGELFVLSSLYEGMPNALIEAMAMGLPVITTDYSDGRGTIVSHQENGLLVPREDVEALSNAIIYMIEHPSEAWTMGRRATAIRELLDSKRICSLWADALRETMSAR